MINEAAVAESVTRRVQGRLSKTECVDTAAGAVNTARKADGRLEKVVESPAVSCGKRSRAGATAGVDRDEFDDAVGSSGVRAGDGDRVNDVV